MTNPPASTATHPHILFITRSYPPIRGGMEQFSYDLTTSIAAHLPTTIIANRHGKKALPFFFVLALVRSLRALPHCDIIHIGDPVLLGIGVILRRLSGKPVAVNIHGLDILYPSRLYQWYVRHTMHAADLCICISRHVETLLKQRFAVQRTIVIPPGIQDMMYKKGVQKEELASILGRDIVGKRILLTVGRLVRRKGVAWFAEYVLPHLPSDVLYVVVGKGPEAERVEKIAKEKGLSDHVLLTNTLPYEQLRTIYNTADIFVMPNIPLEHDAEGFGLVALEAATCALPVVASAVEGIVDAIFDGRNGVLVEAQNATDFVQTIQRLLDDVEKRKVVGEAARRFTLQRFSWNAISTRYIELFQHLQRM